MSTYYGQSLCSYWGKADKNQTLPLLLLSFNTHVHPNFLKSKSLISCALMSSPCTKETMLCGLVQLFHFQRHTHIYSSSRLMKLLSEPRLTLMSWFMQIHTIICPVDTVGWLTSASEREAPSLFHLERIPTIPFVGHDLHFVDSFLVEF